MGIWATDRLRSFREQFELYGTTVTFNGVPYDALATPFEVGDTMQMSGEFAGVDSVFTIARTDYDASGIKRDSVVTSSGRNFKVIGFLDDSADPFVDLRCNALNARIT